MPNFPPGLYAITDPILLPGNSLFIGVEQALCGGASIIQYRDKTASSIELFKSAQNLRDLCTNYGAKLIINDDLELCLRVNADGLHLGKSDGDIEKAKQRLGKDKIIGVTCHSDLSYASHCHELGIDYCAFGRVFPSNTKPNAPHCKLEVLIQAAKQAYSSVAIGGITLDNLDTIMNTNIQSIAVINGLFAQKNIESAARIFTTRLNASHEVLSTL